MTKKHNNNLKIDNNSKETQSQAKSRRLTGILEFEKNDSLSLINSRIVMQILLKSKSSN